MTYVNDTVYIARADIQPRRSRSSGSEERTSSRALCCMALAAGLASLAAGEAHAGGGNYVFTGGTPNEQAQVRDALEASTFPWDVVPGQIVIRIAPGALTAASPGVISLDSNLIDSGVFAWGLIQHEYAHQVDFFLFDDNTRARLAQLLRAKAWCWPGSGGEREHSDYGCERFASTLAWAYWPSPDNALRPTGSATESAALPPAVFKRLLGTVLHGRGETITTDVTSALVAYAPPLHPRRRPSISRPGRRSKTSSAPRTAPARRPASIRTT